MTYDKQQRKQIAKAFKAAKTYLEDGSGRYKAKQSSYICFAVDEARTSKRISQFACDAATQVVRERLAKYGTAQVRGYLSYLNVPRKDLIYPNIQAFRHLWLDELIREFSA